jgi:hypothetical protein
MIDEEVDYRSEEYETLEVPSLSSKGLERIHAISGAGASRHAGLKILTIGNQTPVVSHYVGKVKGLVQSINQQNLFGGSISQNLGIAFVRTTGVLEHIAYQNQPPEAPSVGRVKAALASSQTEAAQILTNELSAVQSSRLALAELMSLAECVVDVPTPLRRALAEALWAGIRALKAASDERLRAGFAAGVRRLTAMMSSEEIPQLIELMQEAITLDNLDLVIQRIYKHFSRKEPPVAESRARLSQRLRQVSLGFFHKDVLTSPRNISVAVGVLLALVSIGEGAAVEEASRFASAASPGARRLATRLMEDELEAILSGRVDEGRRALARRVSALLS